MAVLKGCESLRSGEIGTRKVFILVVCQDRKLEFFFSIECSSLGSPAILYDEPQTETCEFCSQPLKTLEKKVSEADALLLVTDKPGFEIPLALQPVKHHLTGKSYVWRPYGINCTLIGGSVHSRQVAMRLHSLLEGSDFPYMAGVLPSTCSWTEKYAIDPSLETPGPCVL